jgi:RNA-binding protein YlmH
MQNSSRSILDARIEDLIIKSEKSGQTVYSDFLSESEAATAEKILRSHNCSYKLYGGYENAEYRLLAVFSDTEPEISDFPISCLKISSTNKSSSISHRDYMGSIMATGIERDSFGDIIAFPTEAYVFTKNVIADYISDSLSYVGRDKCTVSAVPLSSSALFERRFEEKTIIITSNRVDCIVAAICNFSREKASDCVEAKLVFINGLPAQNSAQKIFENDKVVIRGYGKYLIGGIEGKTHKDRLRLTVKKYN